MEVWQVTICTCLIWGMERRWLSGWLYQSLAQPQAEGMATLSFFQNPICLCSEATLDRNQLTMYGAWVLNELRFLGINSTLERICPPQEFTTQQLFAKQAQLQGWWSVLVAEQLINQVLLILGDSEDTEMEDGIGSRLLIKLERHLHHVINTQLYFWAP